MITRAAPIPLRVDELIKHGRYDGEQHTEVQSTTTRTLAGVRDELIDVVWGATRQPDGRHGQGIGDSLTASPSQHSTSAPSAKLNPAAAQRAKRVKWRQLGATGLVAADREDMGSMELSKVLRLQNRTRRRAKLWGKEKPDGSDLEALAVWQAKMKIESAAQVEVDGAVSRLRKSLKRARVEAGFNFFDKPHTPRPRGQVGLTEYELDLFQSHDVSRRAMLRIRLLKRIQKAEARLATPLFRTDVETLRARLMADKAWLELIEVTRKTASQDAEKIVLEVMIAIAGLSPAGAARHIPAIVARLKAGSGAESSENSDAPSATNSSPTSLMPEQVVSAHSYVQAAKAQRTPVAGTSSRLPNSPSLPLSQMPSSSTDSRALFHKYLKELKKTVSTASSPSLTLPTSNPHKRGHSQYHHLLTK